MLKKERLKKILELIETYEIDTQEELTERLNGAGLHVSQATVSRSINELNLVKAPGKEKKFRYVLGETQFSQVPKKILDLFKHVSVSCVAAGNLVVLKTLAGNAGTAGMAVDQMRFPQIIGTIAGDDTLLIITKSNSDAELVIKKLRSI